MDRILMESSEWNALLISGVTRSAYWRECCLSCCAAVLDAWRHPVKVNAAAMHAMAMTICSFMICDGCDVFYWSARSVPPNHCLTRCLDLMTSHYGCSW